MIQIQVPDQNDSLLEVSLDGSTFFIHLAWNSTVGYWAIGILDADQNTLVDGLYLALNFSLFDRIQTPSFPLGKLMAVTTNAQQSSAAYDDLINGTVALIYVTLDDIEAIS